MKRITSEVAAKKIGNIYEMIIIANKRTRELNRGYKSDIFPNKNAKNICLAMEEIEEGLITREYLSKIK